MSRLFGEKTSLDIDGFHVTKEETSNPRPDGQGYYLTKVYTFSRIGKPAEQANAQQPKIVKPRSIPNMQPSPLNASSFPAVFHDPGVGTNVSFEGNPFAKSPDAQGAVESVVAKMK